MNELLIKQIMADYSVTKEQILDNKNYFTVYKINDDRRKYKHIEECKLRCVAINNKVIFTGTKEIIEEMEKEFEDFDGRWIYEIGLIRKIDKILEKYGQKISMLHPYYISDKKTEVKYNGFNVVRFDQEGLKQFIEDERIDEALGGHDYSPDIVGYCAYINNEFVGIAAASADSPYMAQIGINVFEGFENKHIASTLVNLVKNDLIDMGYLPYYGTSLSHMASQMVALNAGFKPAFVEMFTMPIDVE